MLLDPFEEQFHLPATAIKFGDGQGRKVEIVGKEDEQLVVFGIVELHAAQLDRVILAGSYPGQHDGLVATQAGRFVDRLRINPPVLKIGFGARNKEGLSQMQGMEPGEVDIASIHDIEAAGLEGNPVENVHIVELAV